MPCVWKGDSTLWPGGRSTTAICWTSETCGRKDWELLSNLHLLQDRSCGVRKWQELQSQIFLASDPAIPLADTYSLSHMSKPDKSHQRQIIMASCLVHCTTSAFLTHFKLLNCFEKAFNLQIVPWFSLYGQCLMELIPHINKKEQCHGVLVACTFRLNSKQLRMAGQGGQWHWRHWSELHVSQRIVWFSAVDTIKYAKWLLKCKC